MNGRLYIVYDDHVYRFNKIQVQLRTKIQMHSDPPYVSSTV